MNTAQSIKALHVEFDALMKQFAEKHGLVAAATSFKYNADSFTVTGLRFQSKESNPDAIDPRYLSDLMRNGMFTGLNSSMIGTELVLQAKRGMTPKFKFVGMRASKAVCINLGDNRPYLWDARFIASQIKLQAAK